jgi:uncharacterized membrane protein YbjE (DUF340 family)
MKITVGSLQFLKEFAKEIIAYFVNPKILRQNLLNRSTKMDIYLTPTRPVVTYPAET